MLRDLCRFLGVEMRRVDPNVLPPLPLTMYWLTYRDYFRALLGRVASLPGDVVECGVGDGRSLLLLASLMQSPSDARRHLIGFDSFKGFPTPTQEDDSCLRHPKQAEFTGTTPARVSQFLETSGIPRSFMQSSLELVEGFLQESLPSWRPRPIALLHLDVDLYESYLTALHWLFPHVVEGGIVCFDEYRDLRWPGATKAIETYFANTRYVIRHEEPFWGKHYLVKHGLQLPSGTCVGV